MLVVGDKREFWEHSFVEASITLECVSGIVAEKHVCSHSKEKPKNTRVTLGLLRCSLLTVEQSSGAHERWARIPVLSQDSRKHCSRTGEEWRGYVPFFLGA